MIFHQERTHPLSHNRVFSTGGRWRESPSPAENLLITRPPPPAKIPSAQQTPPYQIFILIFIFLFLFYFLFPLPALNNNFQVTTQ